MREEWTDILEDEASITELLAELTIHCPSYDPGPVGAPVGGPVKTLAMMTDAEVSEMERLYGPLSTEARKRRGMARFGE